MHRVTTPCFAALLIAAAGISTAQTSEKAPASDLAWTFSKDAKDSYTVSWDLKVKQGLSGAQPMDLATIGVKVTYLLDQVVTKVDGGKGAIKGTIKSLKVESGMDMMGMPGPKNSYDSEKPEGASAIMSALGKAVGGELTFHMSKQGEVSEVAGGDELAQKIQAAVQEAAMKQRQGGGGGGGGMGPMGNPELQGAMLGSMAFMNESITGSLNLLHHVLPSEKKAQGETWKIKQGLEVNVGSLSFTGVYKHDGSVKGKTRIGFKNDGEVKMAKKEGGMGGMPGLNLDLTVTKSELKGLSTFGEGKLVDSEVSLDVSTEGEMPDMLKQRMQMMGGGVPEGTKLAIGYKLTLRTSRKDAASGGGEKF